MMNLLTDMIPILLSSKSDENDVMIYAEDIRYTETRTTITAVHLRGGTAVAVKETPEQIKRMIREALKQRCTDVQEWTKETIKSRAYDGMA